MVDSYVVIGGEGFLGGRTVEMLLERFPKASVTSFDLQQRNTTGRQTFEAVDLTDQHALTAALKRAGATCVFHVAAAPYFAGKALAQKVNVEGTKSVIQACKAAGVKKLVYTSSAGAFFDGSDNINVDERLPPSVAYADPYNLTKVEAEKLVLAANGQDGLLTCAIRPSGIFGPGDRTQMPPIIKSLKDGKTGVIIGKNDNLWDWTYVDNIVHAHLLAAERLTQAAEPADFATRPDGVDLTLRLRPVPTSTLRPDGRWLPFEQQVKDAQPDPPLKAMRTRLDQFVGKPSVAVAGQAFFISNGEPIFFWDHVRALHYHYNGHDNASKAFKMPYSVALVFAVLFETFAWLIGKKDPEFTRSRVTYMRAERFHEIERARKVLGYEPIVGYEEGVKRGVAWFKADEARAKKA